MGFKTHYDNLKVSRDAPPEVIRAAYESLLLKFHPDRHPQGSDTARVTKIISDAYAVLSDPVRRRQHDEWIAREEAKTKDANWSDFNQFDAKPKPSFVSTWATRIRAHVASMELGHAGMKLVSYGLIAAIFVGVIYFSSSKNDAPDLPATPIPEVYSQAQPQATGSLPPVAPAAERAPLPPIAAVQRPVYLRPTLTPRGRPWPVTASYLKEFKQLHTKGMSEVTIDNSGNGSDVFVKLVALEGTKAYPVRELFVPANQKFTINRVSSGSYDVRYRDLDTGQLARTERFTVEQTPMSGGVQYSQIDLTLYKIANGNMHTYDLAESDF
ncbi:J domain-containing protein [Rhodanobacter denitrificans]|uniref:DnaJ-class molecular chaperone with C-terminal Zn finger domain n=1 Tax=Rhodanobacter denitrificans TaxID=666685 RepID=M4NM25_9GAMM|nr:J domain-containing protein [Rhodanobacter denitrificans]AGG88786.1 DnaJ-class molecular chaperone with C-terminal Zn finger domain [Rhodanobacter denitrificans]UJJ58547.1 DnaJ domain-containing protein [Rhodanobacter denitrificans]UJM87918.1 DnaJ domain-containing protein [Rhodanobacter denitrificans]